MAAVTISSQFSKLREEGNDAGAAELLHESAVLEVPGRKFTGKAEIVAFWAASKGQPQPVFGAWEASSETEAFRNGAAGATNVRHSITTEGGLIKSISVAVV